MAKRIGLAALVASITIGLLPGPVNADQPLDFDTPNGHFYTQTNGQPRGTSQNGYEISDSNGIPFWTFFVDHGGIDVFGYPVSDRFTWDGFTCQATQRAVLQWDDRSKQVRLANVMDFFTRIQRDSLLHSTGLAPPPLSFSNESHMLFPQIMKDRGALLGEDSAIAAYYRTEHSAELLYGLPTSHAVDFGLYRAQRFQRVVLYHWKEPKPWTTNQGVAVGLAGDLFKELGGVPLSAAVPRLLDARFATFELSSRGGRRDVQTGVATWYGANFQGRAMANSIPYNMYNPSTAASNTYPLGTWLRITRRTTGQSILVQVTDRGAFQYPILVDLSYSAFSRLASPSIGVIGITVERAQ